MASQSAMPIARKASAMSPREQTELCPTIPEKQPPPPPPPPLLPVGATPAPPSLDGVLFELDDAEAGAPPPPLDATVPNPPGGSGGGPLEAYTNPPEGGTIGFVDPTIGGTASDTVEPVRFLTK